MPGTEVAVTPKKRKKGIDANRDVQKQSSVKEQLMMKALLRVQAADKRHVHRFRFGDVELGVLLTSVVYIHPETASKFSFDNHQLITIFPRLPPNEIMQNGKDIIQRRGNNSPSTDRSNGLLIPGKEAVRHTVVRILFSDSVAKGHVMLPQSLRLFIGAGVHSCKYVKLNSLCDVNFVELLLFLFCISSNLIVVVAGKINGCFMLQF